MLGINKFEIYGVSLNEPTYGQFQNGGQYAKIRIGTTQKYYDKTEMINKEIKKTHEVTVTRVDLIDYVKINVHRGTTVYIEGSLSSTEKTTQTGEKYYTAGLSPIRIEADNSQLEPVAPQPQPVAQPTQDITSDDLPF